MKFAGFVVASVSALIVMSSAMAGTYGPGVSDTEIKLGQTMPFSGPASSYSTVGKTEAAFFRMLNDQGGINGRKITLIAYDDAYNPTKTVEQTRKLVEADEVLCIFQSLGTPTNSAVQKYLNTKHVPQLWISSGATRFSDPKEYPWTIAFNASYRSEGRVYGKFVLDNFPDAKIGILYQNDDLGRDYLRGLKERLGDKADSMIVGEASYDITDPTIDSQIVKLRAAGATLFYDAATTKFAAQAIRKIAEIGWKPIHILNNTSVSIGAVMQPAGFENSQGIISASYYKEPLDPDWKDDEGMKRFKSFMERYYPDGDVTNAFNAYAYSAAQVMVATLRAAGDDLTRENVMKVAASLHGVVTDVSLPGMTASTAPDDYRLNRSFRMMRFADQRWVLFGPIVSDDLSTK